MVQDDPVTVAGPLEIADTVVASVDTGVRWKVDDFVLAVVADDHDAADVAGMTEVRFVTCPLVRPRVQQPRLSPASPFAAFFYHLDQVRC